MKCKECLTDFIRTFDLFSLSQFLRYRQDEDYKTISGGITSILVVTIFVILFANNALSTVNKTNISWSSTTENAFEPAPTTIDFSNSKMMFALGIFGLDLNNPYFRYFDFKII